MSRCQSVAIEQTARYWPGYWPCWDGPLSVRRKEGSRGWGSGGMDGLMGGGVGKVEGWQSPRERESGGSWRGPLGPLNWHVQASGLSWGKRFNKTCDNIQWSLIFKRTLRSGPLFCFKSYFIGLIWHAFYYNYLLHNSTYTYIIPIITRPILLFNTVWPFSMLFLKYKYIFYQWRVFMVLFVRFSCRKHTECG